MTAMSMHNCPFTVISSLSFTLYYITRQQGKELVIKALKIQLHIIGMKRNNTTTR